MFAAIVTGLLRSSWIPVLDIAFEGALTGLLDVRHY